MSVRHLQPLERHSYMQDGERLIYLLSLSGTEVLIEDALTGQESLMSVKELSRGWKRVHREEKAA